MNSYILKIEKQKLNKKVPPYNLLAEEIILGGILLDPKILAKISHKLKPEAFVRIGLEIIDKKFGH